MDDCGGSKLHIEDFLARLPEVNLRELQDQRVDAVLCNGKEVLEALIATISLRMVNVRVWQRPLDAYTFI